jgi:hypothetical protein
MRLFALLLLALVFNVHAAAESAELRKKLKTTRVTMDFAAVPCDEAIKSLCTLHKINYKLDPESKASTHKFSFNAQQCELGVTLNWLARAAGVRMVIQKNGLAFGNSIAFYRENLVKTTYDVKDLSQLVKRTTGAFTLFLNGPDYERWISDQCYGYVDLDPAFGCGIELKKANEIVESLVVSQLPEVHEGVTALLAAMREAKRAPLGVAVLTGPSSEVWRAELQKKLQTKISIQSKGKLIDDAMAFIAGQTKLSIGRGPLNAPLPVIELDLKDVTIAQVLDSATKQSNTEWVVADQMILVCNKKMSESYVFMEPRIYNTSRLREPLSNVFHDVMEKVKMHSDGGEDFSENFDLLFFRQPPEVQEKIKAYMKSQPTK